MVLKFYGFFKQNTANILRKAGYFANYDPHTGKSSFIRKIGAGWYPRFHIYVTKDIPGEIWIDFHADMKKQTYGDNTAHSGEYEGDLVVTEGTRLKSIFNSFFVENKNEIKDNKIEEKGFWTKLKKIFGL